MRCAVTTLQELNAGSRHMHGSNQVISIHNAVCKDQVISIRNAACKDQVMHMQNAVCTHKENVLYIQRTWCFGNPTKP